MFSSMLDPKLKSLHLVSSFIGHEQGISIMKEYDKKSLYHMLVNFVIICIHWQIMEMFM